MRWACLLTVLLTSSQGLTQTTVPPVPTREFRGAWVATVRGIDWPFEPGDPTEKQQNEIVAIVAKATEIKLNALIFQVRPAGDAVYKSDIEPWSPWFTGAMGKAPLPLWDPLTFFIKEAHEHGIELHAWFNPFRALSGTKYSGSSKHVSKEHPEWCINYGEDLWMDPGEAGVRERSKAVILDVLRRYDVDGIHMDDYFYPYPLKKNGVTIEFQDARTWNAYRTTGGVLSRSDWRRSNVDNFIQTVYEDIKMEKPWVRFGISPFGIWRPNNPEGYAKGALDAYEDISADSLKWLQNGWCDYLSPQLYWPTEPKNLSFNILFDWWLTQNTSRRHIWPGIASDRVLSDRQPSDILRQISYTRQRAVYMPPGHLHWNFTALMKNKGTLADLCEKRAYQDFAIPPSASWLGSDRPDTPSLKIQNGKAEWSYADARMENYVKWWLVQVFENNQWVSKKLLPVTVKSFTITKDMAAVAIRAISRTGMASDAVVSH